MTNKKWLHRAPPAIAAFTAHIAKNKTPRTPTPYNNPYGFTSNKPSRKIRVQRSILPTKKGYSKQKDVVRQIGNHVVDKGYNKLTYKQGKAAKMYKKIGNVCTYDITETFGYLCGESVQAVNTLTGCYQVTDTKLAFQHAATRYNTPNISIDYQTINQSGFPVLKFLIKSCMWQMNLINQGPGTVEVDLYMCMQKNTTAAAVDPGVSWSTGLQDEVGNGSNNQTNPYTTPTSVKQFNIDWKVVKKIRLSLESGREYKHTMMFRPNRIIDGEYFYNNAGVKGITFRPLLVIRGTLGDSSDATTAAIGNVGLNPCKVIGTVRRMYKTCVVSPFSTSIMHTNNLHTGDTHLYEMDAETDQVVDTIANVIVSAATSNMA
nr:MAG: capsid protein [Cressdnaviricota sp.]